MSVLSQNLRQPGQIRDRACCPPQARALTLGPPVALLPLGKAVRARRQDEGAGRGPHIVWE